MKTDWFTKIGNFILTGLAFFIPLTMHLGLRDSFDLPKMVVVYMAVGLLMSIWLLRIVVSGRLVWKYSPLDVPLVVYLVSLGVATFFSVNPRVSFFGQYREYAFGFLPTLSFAVLFWMTVQFLERRFISILVRAVVTSGTLVAVYAVLQYVGYEVFAGMPKAEGARIWSTLGNPLYLGAFLAMVIPVVLGELFAVETPKTENRSAPFLLTFSLVTMIIALILTLSRSAWMGVVAAIVIFGLSLLVKCQYTSVVRSNLKPVVLTVFISAALLAGVLSVYRPARQRFASIFNPAEASNAARLAGWKSALEIFKEHPFTGTGPDNFREMFRAKRSLAYVRATGPYTTQAHAHNDLLQIASTSGIFGLGAYLWICATLVIFGFRAWKIEGKGKIGMGWFCGLAALFVQNQFNFSTVTTSVLAAIYGGVLSSQMNDISGDYPKMRDCFADARNDDFSGRLTSSVGRIFMTSIVLVLLGAVGTLSWRTLCADIGYKNGFAFMSAKDPSRAILCLEGAVKLNPNVSDYRLLLANAYRDMALAIGNPKDRLPFLKKALFQSQEIVRLGQYDPDSYTNLGVAFMWLTQLAGEDHRQEAWGAFRKAVEIDPYSVETWAHLARTAHFFGDVGKEKQLWQKVLEIDPNHSTAKQMLVQKIDGLDSR